MTNTNNMNTVSANVEEMKGANTMTNINFDKENNQFATKMDAYNFLVQTVRENPVGKYQAATLKFLEHEIELLNNRKAKATGKKKEENPINRTIAELIIKVLQDQEKEMTLSEMLEDARLTTFIDEKGTEKKMTVQKLSFCIGLIEEQIERKKVKGRMVFKLK